MDTDPICKECDNPNCPWSLVTQRDIDEALGNPAECPECGVYDDMVVTDAQRKILSAMENASKFSLLELASIPQGSRFASVGLACKAELARRESKS